MHRHAENEAPQKHESLPSTTLDPFEMVRMGFLREVGNQAIWTLSSCKPGFGVDQLRDDLLDTYWQSDGQLPHLISIQFKKKTVIADICIYTDYRMDESYTPSRLSIRAGSSYNDIQEIETVEFHEPNGWVVIPVKSAKNGVLKTFLLQIAVISNHQNGRDTHIRQIKVHSPADPLFGGLGHGTQQYPTNFTTREFLQYTTLRYFTTTSR